MICKDNQAARNAAVKYWDEFTKAKLPAEYQKFYTKVKLELRDVAANPWKMCETIKYGYQDFLKYLNATMAQTHGPGFVSQLEFELWKHLAEVWDLVHSNSEQVLHVILFYFLIHGICIMLFVTQ